MSTEAGRAVGPAQLLAESWNLLLLALRALLPFLAVVLVVLLAWAVMSRQPWPFSVQARSESARLHLTADLETNWRIGGAVLCIRSGAASGIADLPVLKGDDYCTGRRWRAFDLKDFGEAVLHMPADSHRAKPYYASLDTKADGGLAMEISGSGKDKGSLKVQLDGQSGRVDIGHSALLHFPAPKAGEHPRRLLLPFTGAGSIGKDVTWSEPSLLRGGTVSLYTRSEETAGGRQLVSTTQLLPGDRVDLGLGSDAGKGAIKGFVHFDLAPASGEPPAMTIVALGEAETVRIVRFGDQGYSFSPGVFARLTRHSAISTWAMVIVFILGLMSVYKDGAELGQGNLGKRYRKLRQHWRIFRQPSEEKLD